jgi:hypothetical protein
LISLAVNPFRVKNLITARCSKLYIFQKMSTAGR